MSKKISAKVWTDSVVKVDSASVISPELLTDETQATKWAKVLFNGLKAYYHKHAYKIEVKAEEHSEPSTLAFFATEEQNSDEW